MIEGSDSQEEGLHKILYQAYHMLKKVKYAQMLTCQKLRLPCFPIRKKYNRQADRHSTELQSCDTLMQNCGNCLFYLLATSIKFCGLFCQEVDGGSSLGETVDLHLTIVMPMDEPFLDQ